MIEFIFQNPIALTTLWFAISSIAMFYLWKIGKVVGRSEMLAMFAIAVVTRTAIALGPVLGYLSDQSIINILSPIPLIFAALAWFFMYRAIIRVVIKNRIST